MRPGRIVIPLRTPMNPFDTIDLRSDTVTRPTPAMRDAMARGRCRRS